MYTVHCKVYTVHMYTIIVYIVSCLKFTHFAELMVIVYTTIVYTIHYTAGVANPWPFSKKLWPFLNSEEQKKRSSNQKIWKKWLKNRSSWPSTKKVYNFSIFWPTYHKRLATPAIQYTHIRYYRTTDETKRDSKWQDCISLTVYTRRT